MNSNKAKIKKEIAKEEADAKKQAEIEKNIKKATASELQTHRPPIKLNFGRKSIRNRWIFNSLLPVFIVLLVLDIILIYAVHAYYYSNAKQYLTTKLNSVTTILHKYSENDNINFSNELNNTIEGFSEKDKMELMAINKSGQIVLTSSGFKAEQEKEMPDYDLLKSGQDGYWQGTLSAGEKVMAVSIDISEYSKEFSTLRVITSLAKVDDAILTVACIIVALSAVIFSIVLIIGLYFVNSIVKPILDINKIANKFAQGDFSEKIKIDTKDEIGQLADALNQMSAALANTDNMKNEFISSVSHELRTPLTAIKGWEEMIEYDEGLSDDTKVGIKIIKEETDRLVHLVEELLDFSKMQTGNFKLQSTPVDIIAELEETIIIYTPKAKNAGIDLIFNYDEKNSNIPLVTGDSERIKQVFVNIIDNAIKYSNKGGAVNIDVRSRNDFVIVDITDDGIGIEADKLPHVKEKFYRANHSDNIGGNGIGLAVANEIIEMQGGKLDINSKFGVGTTVTVTFPCKKK